MMTLALLAVAFCGTFESGLTGWEMVNYKGRAVFAPREIAGERAVSVTRSPSAGEKGGTAWELRGAPFAVTPGERLSVTVKARGTVEQMFAPNGFKGLYMTCVRWYGADGKELVGRHTGFGLDLVPSAWQYSFARMTVPKGAVTARVTLGADTPNITAKDEIAIASVTAEAFPAEGVAGTSLRADGTVLVDGKPFFPIGIYGVRKNDFNGQSFDRAVADLKALGFNTVQRHGVLPKEDYEEFLAAVEKHGMMTFTMPVSNYAKDIFTEGTVRDYRDRKCILAWYLADDTSSYAKPATVALRRDIVRQLDPDRLTLQADAEMLDDRFDRYAAYVHATDVFLPELYPCRSKQASGAEVASVVRDMELIRADIRKAGGPVKSVWPIVQHFDGWGWERFPTFAELRAMSWASIVHGGRGIVWYTYGSGNPKNRGVTADPQYWKEIGAVCGEIAALQGDLLAFDVGEQPEVRVTDGPAEDALGQPSVSCLLKPTLLVAVNAATNAVVARIGLRGFAEAEVVGEGRSLDVSHGLVDAFAPYAVHLYRLKGGCDFL